MKKILFFLLILAAFTVQAQKEVIPILKPQSSEMYMPPPVTKKAASLEKRQSLRIHYKLGSELYFWDCDTITKMVGGYLAITTLKNGIIVERFVTESSFISINKLR